MTNNANFAINVKKLQFDIIVVKFLLYKLEITSGKILSPERRSNLQPSEC